MAILNFECEKGHQFEQLHNEDHPGCPECGSRSDILWVSSRSPHRQLQVPIVLWRYADGSIGVAGGADSKTPKAAERVEVRSFGDYRRYAREINQQFREKDERREERFREAKEAMDRHFRSNLAYMMGQESDPVAKDIYRAALEHRGESSKPSFREFFSIAMEMDRSNYEG